ncbi:MAG: glutamate--cysteine ligase [Rhodospirillales bacterium]
MSAPSAGNANPITSKTQLVDYVASGSKPPSAWRIGTEHEKFAFHKDTLKPLAYDGPDGIRALLEGLTQYSWVPVIEKGNPIALQRGDGSSISLEPGGQFELSGAPLETVHQTCSEVNGHLAQVKTVAEPLGIGFAGFGANPIWTPEEVPWMPKGRYKVMGDYMPRVGTMGLEMMKTTCTVQVNLDYASEADMVKKFRVSLALQPIATALFANSPFSERKPNGRLSHRSHIWTDTDNDRCGMLPFVFEDGFGFERYVDHVLDTPMYFVYRDGVYNDVAGKSFRAFMNGSLDGFQGQVPGMGDWEDHMSTLFPEVRLKKFLEMRGADGGPWRRICALPALWVGLLYCDEALDAAWDLVRDWTIEEQQELRDNVPTLALKTPFRNTTVREIAREVLAISKTGLKRRARLSSMALDETHFLNALHETVASGVTPAEEMMEKYENEWNGSVEPAFREYAY